MLLLDSSVCGLFKWRQFEPEVILLAIGWYLRFSLSYRDVEVWRWVQRYAPELEAALAPAPQADERLVAGGRDVRAGERQMGVLVPGGGLQRCDDRLPSLG